MNKFKYDIIYILIVYLLNIIYKYDFMIIVKFIGSFIAYVIYHFFLFKKIYNYNSNIIKFFKYSLLLSCQLLSNNIFYKNQYFFTIVNLIYISLYILIYIFCDKLSYKYLKNKIKEKKKINMYSDIFKFVLGFLIVEFAFNKTFKNEDMIYLIISIVGIIIFYTYVDDKLF